MSSFSISGRLVDLHQRRIYPATVQVENGRISSIYETDADTGPFLLPGFTDAHIHIESSMLVPSAFAPLAVVHGTVATVSDPHEIANVCGAEGVRYMIANGKQTPFKFFFGAPSCVPATTFEHAGATLDAAAVAQLLQQDDIYYLAEMMNYPGVLHKDPQVMQKIAAAHAAGKPVDGHAPGLKGAEAAQYAAAGIGTDHECVSLEEALDKIAAGMHILIREGSAARNFDALVDLIRLHPEKVMFCSDDKHPDELILHHIDNHVRRALALGHDLFDVLRAACVNPVMHYRLPVGLLREGDPADFIAVGNLEECTVLQTYIDGLLVAENGRPLLSSSQAPAINHFSRRPVHPEQLLIPCPDPHPVIRVIEALDGQLITRAQVLKGKTENGNLVSDTERDVLKMVILNRYDPEAPAAFAFIKNFGLRKGALASTVAHDCHNIIAVGVDDDSLCAAINAVIRHQGGIAVSDDPYETHVLALPIAGLMTDTDGQTVAAAYSRLDQRAKALGSALRAPFMTLSFMALLVIPELKLSDKGLFDGNRFGFIPLIAG